MITEANAYFDPAALVRRITEKHAALRRAEADFAAACASPALSAEQIEAAAAILRGGSAGTGGTDVLLFCLALWLCPQTLCGGKVRRGLRGRLAALSGLSGAEAVTQRLRKVRFWAVRDRRFQEQAREAMKKAGIARVPLIF